MFSPSFTLAFLSTFAVLHLLHADDSSIFTITDADKAKVQGDISYLTNGVSRISISDSWPGDMHVFGKFSYRLASTGTKGNFDIWTAARLGSGKICAFSHNRFCSMDPATLDLYDNRRMYKNCINWITNNESGSSSSKVGLLTSGLDYTEGYVKSPKDSFQTMNDLNGVNFVVIKGSSLNDGLVVTLKSFIQQGGGLILCSSSWDIDYLTSNENQLLVDAGLGYQSGRDYSELPIIVNPKPINDMWKENPWYGSSLLIQDSLISNVNFVDAMSNYSDLIPYYIIQTNFNQSIPHVAKYIAALGFSIVCEKLTEKVPWTIDFSINKDKNPVEFAFIKVYLWIQDSCPKTVNSPIVKAASIIPGYPKGTRETKTISVTIPLNYKTDWQSTGIFMWPGSTLQVTVPDYLVDQTYRLKIGTHKDDVSFKTEFWRWPKVTQDQPITSTSFSFFSFSGGLIYLNIIEKLNPNHEYANISFTGEIVSSPWFVLGKTTESEWAQMIAETKAPLAEVESNDLISTVYTSNLRFIQNVTKLAEWYDAVMQKYYDLSGQNRTVKQRFVIDVQITGGWAHAGYPIMADDGYKSDSFDSWTQDILIQPLDVLETGRYQDDLSHWGIYHEIGHNFQSRNWTSSSEGEVTNNIFPLYMEEFYPDDWYQFGNKDYSPGGSYRQPGQNPTWTLLGSYVDLRQGFGWEAFKQFFRYCLDNGSSDLETSANDNWLKYFSQIVQRDITSHMIEYGKEVTAEAKTFASQFPPWDKKKIVSCVKSVFWNSPCATLYVQSDTMFNFVMVPSSRINVTEALEISFKGVTVGSDPNFDFSYDTPLWATHSFDKSTYTVRMVPQKYLHYDQYIWLSLTSKNGPFTFTDVTVKIVNVAKNKLVHVHERSIEEIVRY